MRDENKTKGQPVNELTVLRERIAELEALVSQGKQVEHDLGERVKELGCLYGITNIIERPGITLDELYQEAVDLLPPAWQYPEVTCAKVTVGEKEYNTNNFKTTEWMQSAGIYVGAQQEGTVEVYYLEARPEACEGPFLKEERLLLDAVAERLGRIIEHKQVEEALRESEDRYRTIFETTGSATIIIEEDTTLSLINAEFERLSGYSKAEVEGKKSWAHFVAKKEDLERMKEFHRLRRIEPNATPGEYDTQLLDRKGNIRNVHVTVDMIPGTKRSIASLLDITGHKQMEERIQQQKDFLANVLESLPHPFYVVDVSDYTIKIANSAAAFGKVSKESTCYALTHGTSRPCSGREHICPLKEVRKTKNPVRTEHLHYDRRGNAINVEVHGYPVFDERGNVSEMIAYSLDITERKRADEARLERAAALARAEEVRKSRQRLVAAQESLRREIAQQLHGSVQNRLVVLLHQLAELERTASPAKLARELKSLRERLAELLETDLRSITRQLYPAILRRGLSPALQSLADQFEASMVIEMELNEEIMRQERDNRDFIPELVRLVAYRIAEEGLTNAVKHAKATEAMVRLEVASEGLLCLTVQDNGQGFDAESVSGGLGIPFIRDYAELVGGKCIISSAPEKGTEVIFTFPLAGPGTEHPERAVPLV